MKARIFVRMFHDERDVHARLLLMREDGWHVCGVFQLRRAEWLALVGLAAKYDLEILHEEPRISSDAVNRASE